GHRGRAHRLVQGDHGRLQVPARCAFRRRVADDRHWQDPQARAGRGVTATVTEVADAVAVAEDRPPPSTVVPGLAVATAGLGLAMLGHRVVPQVGVLTWAVGLGVVAANLNLLPRA